MFRENIIEKIDGESSCHGKVKYHHEETALKAARKMQEKKGQPFEAYKCRHCPDWHVGHPRFYGWTEKAVDSACTIVIMTPPEEKSHD